MSDKQKYKVRVEIRHFYLNIHHFNTPFPVFDDAYTWNIL